MNKNRKPYDDGYFPPVPTGFTIFMRTFLPWQIYRFIVINIKMLGMIRKSHH